MMRPPPKAYRYDTIFPCPTLFRSLKLLRPARVSKPPERHAQTPRAARLFEREPGFRRIAVISVAGAVLPIGLREALERGEGRGLGRRAGGDVDDAAHRIARITRRIGAIDDVELRDVAGAEDPPGGGIAERVG